MHSERNLDSGGIEEARRGEEGEEKSGERLWSAETVLLFRAEQQQSEMLKVDFPLELMQACCEWLPASVKFKLVPFLSLL